LQILLAAALALAPASTEPPVAGAEPAAAAMPAPPTQPADAAVAKAPLPEAAPTGTRPANPDEIVVTGEGSPRKDPAAAVNEVSFEAVQAVDKAIVGPISDGYVMATPRPLRQGVHNALNNLSEPINLVNSLLQFKVGRAFRALGRFGINSTLGVAGLFNFAEKKPFKLRYERNGFANTLGYYGIGAGPYMYLPLIGPTSTRDLVGWVLDKSFLPAVAGPPISNPTFALGTGTIKSLDDRVEFDDQLKEFRDSGGTGAVAP